KKRRGKFTRRFLNKNDPAAERGLAGVTRGFGRRPPLRLGTDIKPECGLVSFDGFDVLDREIIRPSAFRAHGEPRGAVGACELQKRRQVLVPDECDETDVVNTRVRALDIQALDEGMPGPPVELWARAEE